MFNYNNHEWYWRKLIGRPNDLHASTFPNRWLLVKLARVHQIWSWSLKTLARISGLSCGFKFMGWSNLWIYGQLVINKSTKPTLAQFAMPSKYSWSIYFWLPTKVEGNIRQKKVEGNITLFPLFESCVLCCWSWVFKLLYLSTLNLDWFLLIYDNLSDSRIL